MCLDIFLLSKSRFFWNFFFEIIHSMDSIRQILEKYQFSILNFSISQQTNQFSTLNLNFPKTDHQFSVLNWWVKKKVHQFSVLNSRCLFWINQFSVLNWWAKKAILNSVYWIGLFLMDFLFSSRTHHFCNFLQKVLFRVRSQDDNSGVTPGMNQWLHVPKDRPFH